MKRAIIATILGIAASAASVYGQGYIQMTSYLYNQGSPKYSGITFGSGPLAGQYVGAEFQVQLLYEFGTMTSFAPAQGNSLVGIYPGAHDGGSPLTDGAGIFVNGTGNSGAEAVIPGYSGGAVTLEVWAYGTVPGPGSGSYSGYSAPFTISGLQTSILAPAGDILNLLGTGPSAVVQGLQPFSATLVPEPAMLSLAGLASAAVLIFRRRK